MGNSFRILNFQSIKIKLFVSTLYDKVTAFHYAAYRPMLHEPILRHCFGKQTFKHGLDIGCGTGVSTVALKNFCERVTGVDPSEKMISQAAPHTHIDYLLLKDKNLPFAKNTFDICTYAGAWWYGKSEALLHETIRVSREGATILLYDFELDFKHIHNVLGLVPLDLNGYDHNANFEDLDTSAFSAISNQKRQKKLLLSPTEVAHLLCSEKSIYNQLILKFGRSNTFNQLEEKIKSTLDPNGIPVIASTYYTIYSL